MSSAAACSSMTSKMIQTQGLLSSSKLKKEEETMVMHNMQGIVTILGSDCDTNTASASSLRRTLSADMSSKKWLSQNIASSDEELLHSPKSIADSFSSSSSSSEDEDREAEAERERLEIWSSIQRNKKEEQEKAGGAFDMWNSLVSLKDNNEVSKSLPATPYIHPLVKRSKSCLSEKSLEICTESLGSETGSDGLFSSYPPSETGDADQEDHKEQDQQQQQQQEKVTEEEEEEEEEEARYNNYGAAATKKYSPPRSFPPPLPSLSSRQTDGPSLHMRSRRDNGRLVLEAVSVPSQNNFCVQRQDGRLVLTIANHEETKEDIIGDHEVAENDDHGLEELEEEFGGFREEVEHEEDDEDDDDESHESVIEKAPFMSSEITTSCSSVRSLALMMNNKPIGLVNRNPKWSEKFNEVDVNGVEVETGPLAQSLPPRPRVPRLIPSTPATAAASFNFNAYEYYWRTKPTAKDATLLPNPLAHQKHNNLELNNNNTAGSKLIVSGDSKQISNERQKLLVLRGKNGDYMVHNLESCKDSRRSFLFWEPYCIATS